LLCFTTFLSHSSAAHYLPMPCADPAADHTAFAAACAVLLLQRDDDAGSSKKPRVVWSVEMHQQFVQAVNQLGIDSE
jgi:hypothetical protein